MSDNKRVSERIDVHRRATLISPDQEKITATVSNVSLSGLLLFDLSSSLDHSTQYKIEILAANNKSIFLSGVPVRKDKQYIGMKVTQYHQDSKEVFKSFINDLRTTTELVDLLEDSWLDYLFEDDRGKQLKVQYC